MSLVESTPRHVVYVVEHPDDGIVYVGCTNNFDRRWKEHCRRPEFDGCQMREVEHCNWRMDAEAMEAELISRHQPRFNVVQPHGMSGYAHKAAFHDMIAYFFGDDLS